MCPRRLRPAHQGQQRKGLVVLVNRVTPALLPNHNIIIFDHLDYPLRPPPKPLSLLRIRNPTPLLAIRQETS